MALVVTGVALFAQQPDFSGDRTLNLRASRLSPAQAGVQSGRLRIDHRKSTVHVHLTLVTAERAFETDTERTTDGREVRTSPSGRTVISSATWEGPALVFLTRIDSPDCIGSVRVRYELQDGGRVVAVETIRGCGRDQDNIWVFE